MSEYEEALKKFNRAEKALVRAQTKVSETRKLVEKERGKLSIECNCGAITPVKKIPFLRECVPGYSSWDDHDYSYKKSWICPACGDEYYDLETKEFPEGIEKYCNKIYKWQTYEPQEVEELRKRWRDKEHKRHLAKERKRQIEAAKKLLKEEGISHVEK